MPVNAQGGKDEGGEGCEEPEDVKEGDDFGDEGGSLHTVLDWVRQIEVGEEGWDAGQVDGLGGILVVG